jgi:hypothetical protein
MNSEVSEVCIFGIPFKIATRVKTKFTKQSLLTSIPFVVPFFRKGGDILAIRTALAIPKSERGVILATNGLVFRKLRQNENY